MFIKNSRTLFYIFTCFILFFTSSTSFSLNLKNPNFLNLDSEKGLSQATIYDFYEDKKGRVWIATQEGINIFDGVKIKRALLNTDIEGLLSSEFIRDFEASPTNDQNVWAGTLNGIVRVDIDTHDATTFHLSNNPKENQVNKLFFDSKKRLWVGTKQGFFFFDEKTNQFEKIILPELDTQIFDIEELDGYLLIATETGLYQLTNQKNIIDQQGLILFRLDKSEYVSDIEVADDTSVWISHSKGLSKLTLDESEITAKRDLTIGNVKSIKIATDSTIWVGQPKGLSYFSVNDPWPTTPLAKIPHDATNYYSIQKGRVNRIFEDSQGTLWYGTTTGVSYFSPNLQKFKKIVFQDKVDSLPSNSVYGMAESEDRNIWVGTGNGLAHFDQNWKHIKNYSSSEGLSSNSIYDVAAAKDGSIWIATSNGLDHLYPDSGKVDSFKHSNKDKTSIPNNLIFTLMFDKEDMLWLGTAYGLAQFNPRTKKSESYFNDPNNVETLSDNEIYALEKGGDNHILVGTLRGLNRVNKITGKVTRLSKDKGQLANDWIFDILLEDQAIWIATAGGLTKADKALTNFQHFTNKDGLPSNAIYGILKDEQEQLWLSTNNGLSRFSIINNGFVNFLPSNGLQGREFNFESYLKRENGQIVFGGISGLSYAFPKEFQNLITNVITKISDIYLDGEQITIATDPKEIIKLPAKNNLLSISHTAGIQFSLQPSILRYQLYPFDDSWRYLSSTELVASYTNLPPGNYQYVLEASYDGVKWLQTDSRSITKRAWIYQTLYFKILVVLFVIFLIIISILIRDKSRKQNEKKLEQEVLKQTRKKESLIQSLEKTNLEFKEQTIQLERVLEERVRFSKSLSHEIGNALMVFFGYQQRIEAGERLNPAPILLQVTGFGEKLRKLASYTDASLFERYWVRLKDVIVKTENLHAIHAQNKSISLELKCDLDVEVHTFHGALEDIFNNVLSNSLKYTPQGGKVELSVAQTIEGFEIRIKDNGIGFDETTLNDLKKVGYRGLDPRSNSEWGEGLGFAIIEQVLNINNWQWKIDSKLNEGTSISLLIKGDDSIRYLNSQELMSTPIVQRLQKNAEFNVLIIEDDLAIQQQLLTWLAEYTCYAVTNTVRAMSVLQEYEVDLILSDVNLPGKNGMEFVKEIKLIQKYSHIPVIFLTAYLQNYSRLEGYQLGADGYLSKPIREQELKAKLESTLNNRKKLRSFLMDQHDTLTSVNFDIKIKSDITQDSKLKESDIIQQALKMQFDNWVKVSYQNHDEKNTPPPFEDFLQRVNLNISSQTLQRKISSYFGKSYKSLWSEFRLTIIEKLITEGKDLETIAYMTGFSEPSALSRFTKNQSGLSPNEIRRQAS